MPTKQIGRPRLGNKRINMHQTYAFLGNRNLNGPQASYTALSGTAANVPETTYVDDYPWDGMPPTSIYTPNTTDRAAWAIGTANPSNYQDVADNNAFPLVTGFTIIFGAKITGGAISSTYGVALGNGRTDASFGSYVNSSGRMFEMFTDTSNGNLGMNVNYIPSSTWQLATYQQGSTIVANEWHTYGIRRGGDDPSLPVPATLDFWRDGTSTGSTSMSTANGGPTIPIYGYGSVARVCLWGRSPTDNQNQYPLGHMLFMYIWNRNLSGAEMYQVMTDPGSVLASSRKLHLDIPAINEFTQSRDSDWTPTATRIRGTATAKSALWTPTADITKRGGKHLTVTYDPTAEITRDMGKAHVSSYTPAASRSKGSLLSRASTYVPSGVHTTLQLMILELASHFAPSASRRRSTGLQRGTTATYNATRRKATNAQRESTYSPGSDRSFFRAGVNVIIGKIRVRIREMKIRIHVGGGQ